MFAKFSILQNFGPVIKVRTKWMTSTCFKLNKTVNLRQSKLSQLPQQKYKEWRIWLIKSINKGTSIAPRRMSIQAKVLIFLPAEIILHYIKQPGHSWEKQDLQNDQKEQHERGINFTSLTLAASSLKEIVINKMESIRILSMDNEVKAPK